MPEAVSDSSTLIHLAVITRLDLLREFFGAVLIPPAVWQEVVEQGAGRAGAEAVRQAVSQGWMQIRVPQNTPTLSFLRTRLDVGEAEAIALALENAQVLLLLDEEFGRSVARQFGLKITGTLGVLLRAKLTGKIPSIATELNHLRETGRFYLSDSLYQAALREAGE